VRVAGSAVRATDAALLVGPDGLGPDNTLIEEID
jgi:hypothetical protein